MSADLLGAIERAFCKLDQGDIEGAKSILAEAGRAPVQAQGVALSERERFEAWATEKKWGIKPARGESADDYMEGDTEIAWMGWQARAALDQAKPVAREPASERPTAADAGGLSGVQQPKLQVPRTYQQTPKERDAIERYGMACARAASAQGLTDAKDAARYRWLRDPETNPGLVLDKVTGEVPADGIGGGYRTYEYRSGDELDAAIDAAIAALTGST